MNMSVTGPEAVRNIAKPDSQAGHDMKPVIKPAGAKPDDKKADDKSPSAQVPTGAVKTEGADKAEPKKA